ncbi:MAG: pentapeptide repeat-containing protein [Chloroflexota bacterium]|nr:pentapeptide repeat-containing protein [Chloroflexota bacterium]
MLLIRIVLLWLLYRVLGSQGLTVQGETGRDDDPPLAPDATAEPAAEPATEPPPEEEPEAVEALSDNAMTRAPFWVRLSVGIVIPIIGLFGLGLALVAVVAANTGWVLPLIGEVSGDWPLGLLLISMAIWAVWLLWQVPRWQAAAWRRSTELTEREIFDIENSSRGTLGQILGGVAVLAGLIFAWQQLGNTSESLFVSQEGQITDRFTRAVGQLGDADLTIRLGGIYALERIARDSERDHETVMEILAAFARQRSAAETAAEQLLVGSGTPVAATADERAPTTMMLSSLRDIPLDVDVVLKVISRRDSTRDGADCIDLSGMNLTRAVFSGSSLNLTNVCLRNADLRSAKLAGVDFFEADLMGTNFSGADLDRANLSGAQLTGANFVGANLSQANLTGANLTAADLRQATLQGTVLRDALLNGTVLNGAVLVGTDLRGANMLGAELTNATLSGVDLRGAANLTGEQVDVAVLDSASQLPPEIVATPDF